MIKYNKDQLPHVSPFTIPIDGAPLTLEELRKKVDQTKLYGEGYQELKQRQLNAAKASTENKK